MVSGKGSVSKGKGSNTSLKTTVTKIKRERVSENEGSDDETLLPDIRYLESAKVLPRLIAIANRTDDNGVLMEELDTLQMELETLLNSVVLRSLELQKEVAGMTEKPPSPGKKGKFDDRSPKKSKDAVGKMKEISTPVGQIKQLKPKTVPLQKPPVSTDGVVEEYFPVEIAKASTSKNDIPNKFWQSVEPYCAPFTEEDLKFLDEMIAAHNEDEEYFKITPLGRHYTLRWAEDDLHHEQREGARFGDKKKNIAPGLSEDAQKLVEGALAKTNEAASGTALCGPVTQRLISALLEENIVTSSDDMMPVDGHDENAQAVGVKTAFTTPQAVALERRIRQELEEQGLFSLEESCASQQDDEILKELKRCQGELRAISQHNVQQLKRLQRLAQDEIKRQDVRKKLLNHDSEVLDVYRKVMLAKQKKRPLTKKEKESAWKALRDRETLVKLLDT